MDTQQQLAWEKRRAPLAAASATASALLSLAAFIYFGAAVEGEISNDSQTVLAYDEQSSLFITTSVIRALALVLLIPALVYLFKAAKAAAPRPQAWGSHFSILGPILLAVGGLVSAIDRVNAADGAGKLSEKNAEELLRDLPGRVTGFGARRQPRVLAIGLVIVSLSSPRAGLLSRFMGILGMASACATGLSALGWRGSAAPLLKIFYFVSLALLFLGKWPWPPWPRLGDSARPRHGRPRPIASVSSRRCRWPRRAGPPRTGPQTESRVGRSRPLRPASRSASASAADEGRRHGLQQRLRDGGSCRAVRGRGGRRGRRNPHPRRRGRSTRAAVRGGGRSLRADGELSRATTPDHSPTPVSEIRRRGAYLTT